MVLGRETDPTHLSLTLRMALLLFVCLSLFWLPLLASPAATADSGSDSWQQYIRGPSTNIVYPVQILSNYTTGNVTNPEGLLQQDGSTILSRAQPSTPPSWPTGTPPAVPTIVLDFGINVVGFPRISFGGASSNSPGVRLAFSETTTYLTETSDFTRSDNVLGDTITPGSDQFAVPAEPYLWTDTHGCLYGDQVCADGLHGFRYMRISLDALASDSPYTEAYGEVVIDSVSLNYTAFLGTPDTFTGWFECSDAELSQMWFDAAYTNDMVIDTFRVNDTDPRGAASPSLIGKLVIFDGAKRDRDPYVGDLAVSARTLYLTHNVPEASVNVIADLADHQRADGWIPPASINNYTLPLFDYPLYWVVCSYDLFVYTGDSAYMQKYYSTLQRVLNDWYPSVTNSTTSLLDKDDGGASGYGDYAFLPRSGTITYYNALYVLALKNAASIATFLGGHESDAADWTQRAETVSAAINKYLWDNSSGAYLDSLSGIVSHAQDGNSISVLAAVSSPSQTTALLSYLDSHALPYGNPFYDNDSLGAGFSERVYAFISYFEIQARFLSGSAATALDQIRRMYGWMTSHDPTVTFWEGIGTDGSMYEGAYTSAAHGWSTGVLPALTNFVLGAIPTGPGFQTWTIKPIPGDVTWAQGVVPTPNGPLSIYWTAENSSSLFILQVQVPAGTQGDVSVPVSNISSEVTVDGNQVWNGKAEQGSGASFADGYVTVPVQSGAHVINVN
ncbi:glycoside hydrolase family 78 protein [Oidiodendron maius Zn]|uniref:Glycoside hydrolase family 78 protein n=1 Tax=Oidiodendron maius (strain Zn) TaxID=913774 RepID=A0A0C3CFC0_OIDMZ|nr:glycoside hydrolase family 78 protein [Oidiodendron maius Zn]